MTQHVNTHTHTSEHLHLDIDVHTVTHSKLFFEKEDGSASQIDAHVNLVEISIPEKFSLKIFQLLSCLIGSRRFFTKPAPMISGSQSKEIYRFQGGFFHGNGKLLHLQKPHVWLKNVATHAWSCWFCGARWVCESCDKVGLINQPTCTKKGLKVIDINVLLETKSMTLLYWLEKTFCWMFEPSK